MGIIPFVINELTRAVNPIKLREMMAAGCPVVSTALPEVEKYSARETRNVECGGTVAASHAAFIDAVSQRLARPFTQEQRQALSDTMRDETWQHKVDEILTAIGHDS